MMLKTLPRSAICIYEDRPDCFTGVKLSVLSARSHMPDAQIFVGCRSMPQSFADWLTDFPEVRVLSFADYPAQGFNVKPVALLRLLDEGYVEVIWIDSDIIWAEASDIFSQLDRQTLLATQETYWGQQQGGIKRTVNWGLKPGRSLNATVNSGILRVTSAHRHLMASWADMLQHPLYRQAQALPASERPIHMLGDQEVLTALVCSEEFSQMPLRLLQRGREIAQCFGPGGFTPAERLQSLVSGKPAFVHAMGPKPWNRDISPPSLAQAAKSRQFRALYDQIGLELSPYVAAAKPYGPLLGENIDWLSAQTAPGRLLTRLTSGNGTLQGFPVAVVDSLVRRARKHLGIARYHDRAEYVLAQSPLENPARVAERTSPQ
ncbi:nucleotide-diphospho-sugar transferase [Aureimonas fodinaquatilis]|uniref:nucleotide-diphospho-sugar transferase n=1 Tax=Aureimonas fodinaquatilis TaxID=2565783 RepID=UPI00165DE542|nr:nucleotide-diphospho-sugar transferase [Aureimonas fodinaquatilis]